MFCPLSYNEPVFRPPAEAYSLILQATLGCSWNKCSFCEMYKSKKFQVRDKEVIEEINRLGQANINARKFFLADGDAFVLSTNKLLNILGAIKQNFPRSQRVSSYALPKNILSKSLEELKELKAAGLRQVYVGIETGDDELLGLINKGETYQSTIEGLQRAKEAGIKLSVMILTGLGGKKYSEQHAINSAKLVNEVQPELLSLLVLSFPYGEDHYQKHFKGNYQSMTPEELLKEMRLFIQHTRLDGSIFRSDHASNYLSLSGVLSKDKEKLIQQIDNALASPDVLREEWMRGL